MLKRTPTARWLLAFNPAAKAKPNFGLKNVGYFSSTTYHRPGMTYNSFLYVIIPIVAFFATMRANFFIVLDEIAGGGPVEYDYGQKRIHQAAPHEFMFAMGEGYKNGAAKYKETGVPLH